jgi:hypothetical protein
MYFFIVKLKEEANLVTYIVILMLLDELYLNTLSLGIIEKDFIVA